MTDDYKIIVFVNPEKFSSLLTNSISEQIGFHKNIKINGKPNPVYLNNHKHIIYIYENSFEIASFDNNKYKHAKIIIYSDDYIDDIYKPSLPFKIIHHSETDSKKFSHLVEAANYKGISKCFENPNTLYDDISNIIKRRIKNG